MHSVLFCPYPSFLVVFTLLQLNSTVLVQVTSLITFSSMQQLGVSTLVHWQPSLVVVSILYHPHYYCWLSGVVTAGWPGLSPAGGQCALLLCPHYLEQSGLFLWSVPWLERALREDETHIMSKSVVPQRANKSLNNLKILLYLTERT